MHTVYLFAFYGYLTCGKVIFLPLLLHFVPIRFEEYVLLDGIHRCTATVIRYEA